MAEPSGNPMGGIGAMTGAAAMAGLFVVGVCGLFAAFHAYDRNKPEAAGLCLIAAALAFGFAATSVWRR